MSLPVPAGCSPAGAVAAARSLAGVVATAQIFFTLCF